MWQARILARLTTPSERTTTMSHPTTSVSYYSDEYRDMEQRLRPTNLQLEVISLLLEADDISSVYVSVAMLDCRLGEEPWKVGQEITRLPGYWPAKHPSVDGGESDREAKGAAQLFGMLYLGERDGKAAALRVTQYAGMLLQTFDIL